MEYAFSLVLNDLVHASEVDYADCEKFDIVCPSETCHEKVFKAGSPITKRQYFSHFVKRPGANCELRLQQIVQERFREKKLVAPQGQELEKLLSHFEALLMEGMERFTDSTPIKLQTKFMRSRPSYRHFLYQLRDRFRTFGERLTDPALVDELQPPPNTLAVRSRHVVLFLTAPNSFSAMTFAVSYGILNFIAMIDDRREGRPHPRDLYSGPLDDVLSDDEIKDLATLPERKLLPMLAKIMLDESADFALYNRAVRHLTLAMTHTAFMFARQVVVVE